MIPWWLRVWLLGAKSLLLHPLRSSLTILGIFIGVASVIWLLAIGEGISQKAQEQIASLGANNIIVRSIKPSSEASSDGFAPQAYGVTRDDFLRLAGTISTVDRAIPIRELTRRFVYKNRLMDGRLVGCTPQYAEVNKLRVARGHFISDPDLTTESNHCVIAAETAERLFPYENPLGRVVHVEDDAFIVIGVLAPRMPTAGIGGSLAAQDFSKDIYIPISTLWRRIGDFIITSRGGSFEGEVVELSQVTLRVGDTDRVMVTANAVQSTMAQFHEKEDYGVTVPLELLRQAETTRMMFMVFMGLIAAISLVVGGIGIMNIMLATVTERTREIGIRRALGAKRRDITQQFLGETVVLSVVGGLIGILGGLACKLPVAEWLRNSLEWISPGILADLPPVIQTVTPVLVPWSIPLAFGISVGVGVIFGLYPAMRAAHMDPIEALRHE
jgi:putative ABC transport system permease protein